MNRVSNGSAGLLALLPLGVFAIISAWLADSAAASSIVQLSHQLNPDEQIYRYLVSPDEQTVVYLVARDLDGDPNTGGLRLQDIYASRIHGGQAVRLNKPQFADAFLSSLSAVDAKFTPDGKSVVFSGSQEEPGSAGIYRALLDGMSITNLTEGASEGLKLPRSMMLFSDDSRLIFQQEPSGALWSVPASGGQIEPYFSPSLPFRLVDSVVGTPDGKHAVFRGRTNSTSAIFSIGQDGENAVQLSERGIVSHFSVSPDSERIVFAQRRANTSMNEQSLYSVPVSGGPAIELQPGLPDWASSNMGLVTLDSKQVILQTDIDGPDLYSFYRVPIDGGAPVLLNEPVTAGQYVLPQPLALSEQWYYYSRYSETDDSGGVYRASLSEDSYERFGPALPSGTSAGNVWSSDDGSHLFYAAAIDGYYFDHFFVMDQNGENLVVLQPAIPAGSRIGSSRLSPDGRWIVYTADVTRPEIDELFMMSSSGGPAIRLSPELGKDDFDVLSVNVHGNWVLFTLADVRSNSLNQRALYAVQIPEPTLPMISATLFAFLFSVRYRFALGPIVCIV